MNDHTPAPPRPRLLRVAAALAGVFAAYTAFGFLGAPPLLRAQIVKRAAVALHRDVAIAKVRVNPLALSVAIEGLQVKGRAGEPFVGWDALYIRVAPLRLLGGELALSEIRLAGLSAHVGLDAAGALSFQDLLGADEKTAPAAAPA